MSRSFSGSNYHFTTPPYNWKKPRVGFVVIKGDHPTNLKIVDEGVVEVEPFPYGGQYPAGQLVYNGIWYYATYSLDTEKDWWDILGPFVGFNISTNFGKEWISSPRTPFNPIFGESGKNGSRTKMFSMQEKYDQSEYARGTPGVRVKIGAPHFVDFGKNMEHSPDGKAYLVAHGSTRPDSFNSWCSGDQIYLLRVTPSIENINNPEAYEFYGGNDEHGIPVWTGDFKKIKPLLEWNGKMGIVTATYIPPLNKYIMCVTDGHGLKNDTQGPYHTYFMESKSLTGPWKLRTYMKAFGEQAYFVNIPSKFISNDGKKMWLSYSHGWGHKKQNPPGGAYAWCLQEFRFADPEENVKTVVNLLKDGVNIALAATVTVSSVYPKQNLPAESAIDGKIGGPENEWASDGEGVGAWIKLSWSIPQKIDRVLLFDRSNTLDQITAGELEFSDGSKIVVEALEDTATSGREVTFPARETDWVKFTVTDVKKGTPNVGLSEIAVFQAKQR